MQRASRVAVHSPTTFDVSFKPVLMLFPDIELLENKFASLVSVMIACILSCLVAGEVASFILI
jgi:hypothetical protein